MTGTLWLYHLLYSFSTLIRIDLISDGRDLPLVLHPSYILQAVRNVSATRMTAVWLHHAVCCDARRTRRIQELIALMISNGLNIVFIPSAYRHV